MAARTYEQQVAALRALDPGSPAAAAELRKVLRGKRGLLIAVAAKLVEEHRLDALADDLAAAFATLVDDGPKVDPGCRGKLAIAKALDALDHWDDRVFVAGLAIVQREGPPPNPDDTAGPLRGLCGLAHAHFARADVLDVLARLLADPERATRAAAAQGFGDAGRPDGAAVLRYKLHADDEGEPEVLAVVFDALFHLAREASTALAIELLAGTDARAEAAAIALGAARVAEAAAPLAAWCETARPEQRHRVGYVALALLRTDEANAHLLAAIRTRGKADAIAAARALATFREDPAVAAQLAAVLGEVDARTRRELEAVLAGG